MRHGNVFTWQQHLYAILLYMDAGQHVLSGWQVQMKVKISLHPWFCCFWLCWWSAVQEFYVAGIISSFLHSYLCVQISLLASSDITPFQKMSGNNHTIYKIQPPPKCHTFSASTFVSIWWNPRFSVTFYTMSQPLGTEPSTLSFFCCLGNAPCIVSGCNNSHLSHHLFLAILQPFVKLWEAIPKVISSDDHNYSDVKDVLACEVQQIYYHII